MTWINIKNEMMTFNSPLRYPGGKNRLAKFIASVCKKNNITGHYVEPYAGGASVALHLLFNEHMREITINDYDRSVYAFWYSILHHTEKFCNHIKKTKITTQNWNRAKTVQKNKNKASLFELGFSTFFLNRTSYSGIITGGMLGGKKQNSNYKINCRFNKDELIKRIRRIRTYQDRIHLYNLDALELVQKIRRESFSNSNTIFYFDPPYYQKGQLLYMNYYDEDDHKKVGDMIKKIKRSKWIVSYDNTPEIQKIYTGYRKKEYFLFHTAYHTRKGNELLFFSNNLNEMSLTNTVT